MYAIGGTITFLLLAVPGLLWPRLYRGIKLQEARLHYGCALAAGLAAASTWSGQESFVTAFATSVMMAQVWFAILAEARDA